VLGEIRDFKRQLLHYLRNGSPWSATGKKKKHHTERWEVVDRDDLESKMSLFAEHSVGGGGEDGLKKIR